MAMFSICLMRFLGSLLCLISARVSTSMRATGTTPVARSLDRSVTACSALRACWSVACHHRVYVLSCVSSSRSLAVSCLDGMDGAAMDGAASCDCFLGGKPAGSPPRLEGWLPALMAAAPLALTGGMARASAFRYWTVVLAKVKFALHVIFLDKQAPAQVKQASKQVKLHDVAHDCPPG